MKYRLSRQGLFLSFCFYMTAGVLLTMYYGLDDVTRQIPNRFATRAIEEMTGSLGAWLLFPCVVYLIRRFPWPQVWIHALFIPVLSIAHTTFNYASRLLVFWMSGKGVYDYGILSVRYWMELPNDVIVYATMATVVFLLDRYNEAKGREVALARAQLESLRLQLQPHFLFNTLNTISSVMYEDTARADAMLCKLSSLLRWTLEEPHGQKVRLGEEMEYLRLYLDIMKERFRDKMHVTVDVDPDLTDTAVPQLVFQPLVENAFRHGACPGTGEVRLELSARRQGQAVELRVRDHGAGLRESLSNGIGLKNTRERLARLYGDRQETRIENAAGDGACVTVRIPLERIAAQREYALESADSRR